MAELTNRRLEGKRVLLGVSGSIAAFKACELLRLLVKSGAAVRVVMSDAATKLVTPISFSALGAESVSTDMWDQHRDSLEHVSWADWAEVMVIAPATANIIAKIACGIADDVLSTQALAFSGPMVIAPAMNVKMWNNLATKANVKLLRDRGIHFVGPEIGDLASLIHAAGRMSEPEVIFQEIAYLLDRHNDLLGKRIIVTAGPTREDIDPVRFISNRSSGKMGYAIAAAAKKHGAKVTLISGPVEIEPPYGVNLVKVESAAEMSRALARHFRRADALIMAAAVADFAPKKVATQKIKRTNKGHLLALKANPDIVAGLAAKKGKRIVIGFAMETKNLEANARRKLVAKNLDMIVANNPTAAGSGFGSDYNKATFFFPVKKPQRLPLMSKPALAEKIIESLVDLMQKRR